VRGGGGKVDLSGPQGEFRKKWAESKEGGRGSMHRGEVASRPSGKELSKKMKEFSVDSNRVTITRSGRKAKETSQKTGS